MAQLLFLQQLGLVPQQAGCAAVKSGGPSTTRTAVHLPRLLPGLLCGPGAAHTGPALARRQAPGQQQAEEQARLWWGGTAGAADALTSTSTHHHHLIHHQQAMQLSGPPTTTADDSTSGTNQMMHEVHQMIIAV